MNTFLLCFESPLPQRLSSHCFTLVFNAAHSGIECIACMVKEAAHTQIKSNVAKSGLAQIRLKLIQVILPENVIIFLLVGIEGRNDELMLDMIALVKGHGEST